MTQPTTANCQACNAPNSKSWVTITDCGATIICTQCLAELGDDRSKEAFYNLPDDREQPCEKCGEPVPENEHLGNTRPDGTSEYLCPDCYVPMPVFADVLEWFEVNNMPQVGPNNDWCVYAWHVGGDLYAIDATEEADENNEDKHSFMIVRTGNPTVEDMTKPMTFQEMIAWLKTNTGE